MGGKTEPGLCAVCSGFGDGEIDMLRDSSVPPSLGPIFAVRS